MGPAAMESLIQFARAEGNREVVNALASEVRFVRPIRRKRNSRRREPLSAGIDGDEGDGKGDEAGGKTWEVDTGAGAWVEGKTVVFTGSLTRWAIGRLHGRGGDGRVLHRLAVCLPLVDIAMNLLLL